MPPTPKAKSNGPITPVKVLPNTQQLCSIRCSPDGKLLAGGTYEASIRRWDASTDDYKVLPSIKGHDGWVQQVVFHPDNKRLFAVDSFGKLAAWPAAEPEPKPLWAVADAHDGWIHALALSPDGSTLASAGRDRTVRLSTAADGKLITKLSHPEAVMAVAFHPDGKSLVTGDFKGIIRQFDMTSHKQVREFDAKQMHLKYNIQDVGGVRCFTFDEKGTTLVAGGSVPATGGFVTGTTLILACDWQTGKTVHTIKGTGDKDGYVYDMAFHPDGYLMAVSSGQPGSGRLFFQKLGDPQPLMNQLLPNCHSLVLQPSGTRLIVASTNANSSGNGKPKGDEYPGNFTPLHVFDVAKS